MEKSENQRISTAVRQGHSYQSLLVRFAFLHLLQGTSVLVCNRLRYAIIGPVRVFRVGSLHIYTTMLTQRWETKHPDTFNFQNLFTVAGTQCLFCFKDAFCYYCISHLCHHYKAILWHRNRAIETWAKLHESLFCDLALLAERDVIRAPPHLRCQKQPAREKGWKKTLLTKPDHLAICRLLLALLSPACVTASGSAGVYLTEPILLGFQKCTWKESTCNNQYYL